MDLGQVQIRITAHRASRACALSGAPLAVGKWHNPAKIIAQGQPARWSFFDTGGAITDARPQPIALTHPIEMRRLPARAFTAFLPLPNLIFLRGARGLKFPGDFMRLNPHMHNKSFTVDNQASVVGGFNIANAVFGAGISLGLVNLDRFVVDPVMREDGLF